MVSYVKAGGHLLLGPRSGFKDEYSSMLPSRQPGTRLAELLGAHVEEFYTLDRPVEMTGELSAKAKTWAEIFKIDAPDAQVLMRYGRFNGWIDDQPAMVTRQVGKGRITYLGACLEAEDMRRMMQWAVGISGIKAAFAAPPEGVEVCSRVSGNQELYIVINHTGVAQTVVLPRALRNLLADQAPLTDRLQLPPYEVAVLG